MRACLARGAFTKIGYMASPGVCLSTPCEASVRQRGRGDAGQTCMLWWTMVLRRISRMRYVAHLEQSLSLKLVWPRPHACARMRRQSWQMAFSAALSSCARLFAAWFLAMASCSLFHRLCSSARAASVACLRSWAIFTDLCLCLSISFGETLTLPSSHDENHLRFRNERKVHNQPKSILLPYYSSFESFIGTYRQTPWYKSYVYARPVTLAILEAKTWYRASSS